MAGSLRAEPGISSQNIVRALLKASDTSGPPTDPEKIADVVGLTIREFDKDELPPQVRAFLSPRDGIIGVHRNLTSTRRTFSILHEVGHFVLPGHANSLLNHETQRIQDEDETLSSQSVHILEIEANQFAADCLFQLDRFDRTVYIAELSWLNIQIAADRYKASIEATARRWIEQSPNDYALVVFNPTDRKNPPSDLCIGYTITSKSFQERFFSRLVRGQKMGSDTLVYQLFYGLTYQDRPEAILQVALRDEVTEFQMRLFSNSYSVFGLLTPIE